MLNLNQIPTVYTPIHRRKVENLTMLYSPYSQMRMTLMNNEAMKLFDCIDGKKSIGECIKELKTKSVSIKKNDAFQIFDNLFEHEIINFEGKKTISVNLFSRKDTTLTIWFNLTEQCNFRCTYCFVDKNPRRMTEETMRKALDNLYNLKKKYGYTHIRLNLAGGEPLLAIGMIKKIVERVKEIEGDSEPFFVLKVITNGSLLTDEIAEYFAKNRVRISISIDGIDSSNDETRKLANGAGTFKFIEKGLLIAQKHHILNNIGTVVSLKNIKHIHRLAKYCLDNNIGMCMGFFKKTNHLCEGEIINNETWIIPYYRRMLNMVYEHYNKQKIDHSPLQDHFLLDGIKYPMIPSRHSCGAGEIYFTVSTDGKVEFCPASKLQVGTVDDKDIIQKSRDSKELAIFQKTSIEQIKECQKCEWKYICSGGCGAERHYVHNGKNKVSPKCDIYKSLVSIILSLEAKRTIRDNMQ